MNDTKLQELRDWSARKMGWERVYADGIPMWKLPSGRWDVINWKPDDPTTGHIWLLVERMRELGWALHFHARAENKDMGVGFAREWSSYHNLGLYNGNPCLAILLAAKATEEE